MNARLTVVVALALAGASAAARQPAPTANPSPASPAAVPPGGGAIPISDLTAQLRRGIDAAAEGDPDALIALRQLRDQRLRPLFAHLAASGRGEQRVQAALGLAELDDPPRLDSFLLKQLPSGDEQLRVVEAARTVRLFSPAQASEFLVQPGLPPALEAQLSVIAASGGAPVDGTIAKRLAASDVPSVATTGAALLSHAGFSEEAAPILDRVLADTSPEGARLVSLVLQHARTLNSKPLAAFARRVAELPEASASSVAEATDAILAIEPESGRSVWWRAYDRSTDLAQRLRLALIALERAEAAGEAAFALIGRDAGVSPQLIAIARAGAATATGKLGESDLLALVETDYAPAVAWAVNRSGSLGSTGGSGVRTAVIGRLRGKDKAAWVLLEEAVRAAALLADEAPDDFARAYTSACWDKAELPAQAMLLGALRSRSNRAAPIVAGPEAPGAEAKALAAIAAARADGPLTPAQEAALVHAAEGWGGLSIARRAQAAWLALRHAGQERGALAVVLTPVE